MNKDYIQTENKSTPKQPWDRNQVVKGVIDFEQARHEKSQREFAENRGIPRSTLRHWVKRKNSLEGSAAVINFFESPDGLAFLHRLITAAIFIFTKAGIASIHNVSEFIKLCGLSSFVAGSYTSQCRASKQMDEIIIEFGDAEQQRLSKAMRTKKITLAEDETFHPQACLVSIEPESNFIIAERYTEDRKGETWTQLIQDAIEGLPVEVIQITSDEGTGLLSHTLNGFDAHHSPDCFHVPHEIGKGTSGALASQIKKTEKPYNTSVKQVYKIEKKMHDYDEQGKYKGVAYVKLEEQLVEAVKYEKQCETDFEAAKNKQETVRVSKKEIGEVYHPYNIETGEKQSSEQVSYLLEDCFERINEATAHLSEQCKKRVVKAHGVVSKMVATITFFFSMIDVYLENTSLSSYEKELMQTLLIPGYYLQAVANREKDKEKKIEILNKAKELLSDFRQNKGAFLGNSESKRTQMKKAAKECAQIFQRSSSCVEGRNAQLSLRHHGLHRLSDRCLKAQTVIHNYYRKNREKETPAERFFEAKHADLFEYLLEKMDYPARPRKHSKVVA